MPRYPVEGRFFIDAPTELDATNIVRKAVEAAPGHASTHSVTVPNFTTGPRVIIVDLDLSGQGDDAEPCDLQCGQMLFGGAKVCRHGRNLSQSLASVRANNCNN